MPLDILIVEDEAAVRRFINRAVKIYFSRSRIVEATNGIEAAEKLASVNPQLVIMDLGLPGIDGLTLCELIQSQPQHENTQVLAVTGQSRTGIEQEAFDRGVLEFVRKPFEIGELAEAMDRLLARAEQCGTGQPRY